MQIENKKIENVKEFLSAMKVEQKENGVYIRWRKSKNRKLMLDDIFKFPDVMEEDGWKRIGDFEVLLTIEAFEEVHKNYESKFMCREF